MKRNDPIFTARPERYLPKLGEAKTLAFMALIEIAKAVLKRAFVMLGEEEAYSTSIPLANALNSIQQYLDVFYSEGDD